MNNDYNNNYTYHYTFDPQQDNGNYQETYTPYPVEAARAGDTPVKNEKKKKGWTGGRVVALAVICGLLGGVAGFGGSLLSDSLTGSGDTAVTADTENISTIVEGARESSVINVAQVDTSSVMTASEVYAANVNSTVGIQTSITTNYWGFQTTSAASGSGFIITSDGYILTNYHVIEESNSITVTLYDGTSYDAAVVGYDESNDIAVLKIDAEDLVPVILGDSDNMNVGDQVIAIGNPLGELTFSLTSGCVSALDRDVTLSSSVTMKLIQTDCAINSGNSGGALFNMYGEVIGITNAKYSGSGSSTEASIDNIGFAIPINSVRDIVESIIETGYIVKPYIGVYLGSVSADAQSYGLPAGAAISSVIEGSPAEEAGLQANDIVTAVDGEAISDYQGLVDAVGERSIGDVMTLTVYRQGETLEIDVTIGQQTVSALPDESTETQQPSNGDQSGSSWWNFGN